MLTPDKIREKQFTTSGRGSYRADDVDTFMNDVLASYEKMYKENGELVRKISILAKKVEEYRADEENLKMALLNAQRLAEQITTDAKEKAEAESKEAIEAAEKQLADAKAEAEEVAANSKRESSAIIDSAKAEAEKIIADANKEASEMLGNANRQVTHETLVYEMTKKEASEFKSKLVAMYKEHINLINQLPEYVDEQLASEAPTQEETTEEPAVCEAEEVAVEATDDVQATEDEANYVENTEATEDTTPVEPVIEDVYSDSVEVAEAPEEYEEPEEEPVREKSAFKLDLSKIDFAEDDEDEEPAPAEIETNEDVDDDSDDDSDSGESSSSFKNFFKRK